MLTSESQRLKDFGGVLLITGLIGFVLMIANGNSITLAALTVLGLGIYWVGIEQEKALEFKKAFLKRK